MRTHRNKLVAIIAFAAMVAGCAPGGHTAAPAPVTGPTLIYVVRHAERASTEDDSPLNDAGHARAEELARVLADADIDAVYHTQYVRTRDTGAPTAAAAGAPMYIERVDDAAASSRTLAERVLAQHRGESVLVVGHSNTVDQIVRAFGGSEIEPLEDHDYDRIYIVIIGPDGEVSTVRTRFGSPSIAPAG